MEEMIRAFPGQLRLALESPQGLTTFAPGSIRQIAVIGMGGSAFGAEVVRNLIAPQCPVPFVIFRDYELPAWVGSDTLIIASSYSGDTEETLLALESVLDRNPQVLCITSGGKLAALARAEGFDCLLVPGGLPPRKAVGYSIARQLQALQFYGFLPDFRPELNEAIQLLESFDDHQLAKEIAASFHGKLPVIYASAAMGSAALRWRQEIEENAKHLASHAEIPEMNHNELVGWHMPPSLLSQCAAVILRSTHDHERVRMRMDLNRDLIGKKAASVKVVEAKGISRTSQLMYLLHLGDWVSLELAVLNQVDPIPVEVINFLKTELEKR